MDRRTFLNRATALGLSVGGVRWQEALAAQLSETEIRGHVLAGTQPLPNVRVSDGYNVALTDASGEFRMRVGPQSGPFLFVTNPPDYWTDSFYVPVAEAVQQPPVFRLQERTVADSYTAVYVTDIHLGQGHTSESFKRYAATIDEINQLDPLPSLCWAGGDISLQNQQGVRYVEMMSRLKMPVRNGIGNHEMLVDQEVPRDRFQGLFGPTYYSFDVGKVHYITLDGCRIQGRSVEGHVSPQELHWLREDLRRVPEDMTTVVAIHIPLVSSLPERSGTTSARAPGWVVQNADEVIDLLAEHGVGLVLQGHLHENQHSERKGISFVESVSVCGRWWRAVAGETEVGISGEPRGYRILDVDGTKIRHRYQGSAESRVDAVGEIVGRPSSLPASQDATLDVNIFDARPKAIVSARMDDGAFVRLALSQSAAAYHGHSLPAHHWNWPLSKEMLSPGSHRLQVRVDEPGQTPTTFDHPIRI